MSDHLFIPSRTGKYIASTTKTTNASNTTASIALFTVAGAVHVHRLWGVVTTALSNNHTAAHFRMNDGTNTPAVTAAGGTTLSSFDVGSVLGKTALVATAVTASQANQTRVVEAGAANETALQDFVVHAKNGATTTLDYRYSTTNTPATGAIQFFCEWSALSADGVVTAN